MNWISKKLLLSQIKKYFQIEDQNQLQVSVTGQQKLKCLNLKLKKDVVNKPTSPFHVEQLSVKYLQIVYDKTKEQPLKVTVDGITLVLTFNSKLQRQPPQYTKTQETLKAFHEAINKKEIMQRGYLWLQFSQFQKLLIEAFIGRLSLIIKQVSILRQKVDVSIQYKSGESSRVIGAQLGQIVINQRTVISPAQSDHKQTQQDEIHCKFQKVSLYLGIQVQKEMQSKVKSKEIIYKVRTIKKNYLMEKNQISLYYNFSKGNLAINIEQLTLFVSKLAVCELAKITSQLSKYLSQRPLLKPKQGDKKILDFGMEQRAISQGTLKWWRYLCEKVILKISERKNNFFTNSQYRKYMLFLYYKYTIGSNKYIEEQIKKYQKNKIASAIMEIYYTVLKTISAIKQSNEREGEFVFILFLQLSESVRKAQRQHGLKYIQYDDVKNSKIFFNIDNCRSICDSNSSKSLKRNSIKVKSFKLNLIEYKCQNTILDKGLKLSPSFFYELKAKHMDEYYNLIFDNENKSFTNVLKLEMANVKIESSRIQFKISLPVILLSREDNQLVLKISHLILVKENNSLFNQKNTVIVAQKNRLLKINYIYFNIHDDIVRHLLSIKLLMSDNLTKPLSQKQDFQQYLYTNVYRKLSMHPIFQQYKDESFHLQIEKTIIVTSLFTKNQYLTLQLGETSYKSPMQGKSIVKVSNATISRSKLTNIDNFRYGKLQSLSIEKQSVLVQSNKPLIISIEKHRRGHFIDSQQKLKHKAQFVKNNQRLLNSLQFNVEEKDKKIDKNLKDISYVYHQPIIDIVVPFILVQLSFLDIYYFQLTLNYWKEITNSPHFFPKRANKTQLEKQLVKFKELSIQYIEKQDSFTRVSRIRCKLQGIEIGVYGENKRQEDSFDKRIISILLQGLTYENKVYILGQKTKIHIMNMFIHNCLGNKIFNSRRLSDLFSNPNKEEQPLVFPPRVQRQAATTSLILYAIPDDKDEESLLQISIVSHLDLRNLNKLTVMDVKIKPFFIYQDPQYYQIIKNSLEAIFKAAKANCRLKQPNNYIEKGQQLDIEGGTHQILQAKNITEQFRLQVNISRLNILALHNSVPIFTISFLDVLVEHHTELYVTKYRIKADQFYVVDISPYCGLHPIVMKSKTMSCYYTSYQSDLLRQKQRKSAYLKIYFDEAEIHYLNRKIKEFTNFIMSHFKKKDDEDQPDVSQTANSKKNQVQEGKSYPFCYKIEMNNPIIMLLRNSLCTEKFVGQAQSIILHNIQPNKNTSMASDSDDSEQNFFVPNEKKQFDDDSFTSCLQINQQQMHFYECKPQGQEYQESPSNIVVKVTQLNFYPQTKSDRPVIYIPEVLVNIKGIELNAGIAVADFELTQNDYRLLIRITQQNFSQVPVSFPNTSSPSQLRKLDFQSNYNVQKLIMVLKKQKNGVPQFKGQLTMQKIEGSNKLYANGQKQDIIHFENLKYQSYFRGQLKTIIQSKQTEKMQERDILKKVLCKMYQNEIVFSCKDYQSHQNWFQNNQEDQEDLNAFFKTVDGFGFKFGQKNKQKIKRNQLSGTQLEDKEEKKLEKVGKWVGGMCQKCFCCFKKKEEKKQEEEMVENQLIKVRSRPQPLKLQEQNLLDRENYPFLEQSLIQNESQMIKFKRKVIPSHYHKQTHVRHPIFMEIIGQKNRQKRMYMLVQNLIIQYQSKQHVMELINFMNKPYAEPEKPQYVKDSRFNNYRPFQMLAELTNTSIVANHVDIAKVNRSILFNLDMIYNFQKLGDNEKGPGKKTMSVDMLCDLSFQTSKVDKTKSLSLSNKMRIIWEKESKTTLSQKQPKNNKQKLFLYGIQEKSKEKLRSIMRSEKQKSEIIQTPIILKLPISYLKELNELIKNIFAKKESQTSPKEKKKQVRKREVLPKIFPEKIGLKKKSLPYIHQQQVFEMRKKSETTYAGFKKQISNQLDMQNSIIFEEEEPIQKIQKQIVPLLSKNMKVYIVPKLTVQVYVGQRNPYLTKKFENIKYHVLEGCKPQANAQSQKVNLQCAIDYFNLNLVKFEPFLEKTNLQLVIQKYKVEDNENKCVKLLSKAQKDKNSRDYRNGLSVNLSTALYHTLKELHLKFELGNQNMEVWGDMCFNLTTQSTQGHQIALQTKQLNIQKEIINKKHLFQSQPPGLKNFFGKKFLIDNKNEVSKKKSKRKNELTINQFHIEGFRVYLYHSFIESSTKIKKIIYRTPFRFMNYVSEKVDLKLNFRLKGNKRWKYQLSYKDYYCIPSDIYDNDFLVSIQAQKKFRKDFVQQKRQQLQEEMLNQFNIRATSILDQVKSYQSLMSVKYLTQINAKKEDYHLMGKNKFHQYLFSTSNLQNRYIDKRDILIRSNKVTLVLVNIKSDCDEAKDEQSKKNITFYDSLTIIMSPIIIFNFTNLRLGVIMFRKKKYEISPRGKKIQINQFAQNIQFKDITLEFAQDIVHHQYRFFDPQFQVDPITKSVTKKILIDRMQSLNVKITKQTYNTCIVEIFPDWVIINKTQKEFQLRYNQKQFPIDKNSESSLAVDDEKKMSKGDMKIKLYDSLNPGEKFHKFITQTQTLDIFTLVKVQNTTHQIAVKKQLILKQEQGCCGSNEQKIKPSYEQKKNDERPYECIQFVVSIFEGSQYQLTRELLINYKYEVTNSMSYELRFFQSQTDKNPYSQELQGIQLFRLKPGKAHYLYSYDFLPKVYYIVVAFMNQKNEKEDYISNFFACDAKTGQSFSLKLKSLNSTSSQSKYIRVDLNQSHHTNELNFKQIGEKNVKHPFYIQNATSYQVKITENENTFSLNNKEQSPFLWSNLINNNHNIKIQIQGESKQYSLKQNSQFEPIVIRGDKINSKVRKVERNLFKRQSCMVRWSGALAENLVVYDMFSKKLHIKRKDLSSASTFEISSIERIKTYSNKIQLILKSHKYNLEIFPSESTFKDWVEVLSRDIENDIIDKIYFTIQSLEHSMIFFIHNVDISSDNNLQENRTDYVVQNLFISIIYNSSNKVQELLLINMEDIGYSTSERVSQIKYKEGQDNSQSSKKNRSDQNYKIKKSEESFKIKKLKINNQLLDAVNPVILSQIKKSTYPFLQYKAQKQTLIQQTNIVTDKKGIQHYKTRIFFLDEAQLIIEASLFPKLRHFKKFVDDINKNYRMQDAGYENNLESRERKKENKQMYINYMEMMPIKMTISVNFESAQADPSSKLMNFLTLIPAGVENAIITIDSFIFHHVFLEEQLIKKTLKEYYIYEMKKQIVYNAGSIQFFAPLQIIQGLGIGFTNIFYNPLYSLVNNPEIQTFTSNFLEGIITFFVFLVTTGINFVSVVFKLISVLSFDRLFQSKRQMFRKQIFKSPIDGFNYGGRYFIKIVKQYFIKFSEWPCYYHKIFPCFGFFFGLFLAIINIFPWFVKVAVTSFDVFYVVFEGFINWGHYQENSMKYRSRPIRTFPHKQLTPYDYLTAKGNEIMRKHQIQQNDNQAISFISFIDEADESRYIVLSNYRILYCTYQLLSFQQIQLYKISKVVVKPIDKDLQSSESIEMAVYLQIPEKKRNLFLEKNVSEYTVKFSETKKLRDFLANLKLMKEGQHLNFLIEDNQLEQYERYKRSQITT